MTLDEAKKWVADIDNAIAEGKINWYNACDEVFAELETAQTEEVCDFLYEYTRR